MRATIEHFYPNLAATAYNSKRTTILRWARNRNKLEAAAAAGKGEHKKIAMRGVVLCLHGIGDHCRRNLALYERLCREGFGGITYDLLNHGVSDLHRHKTRAHVSNFSHIVEDTNDFIKFAKRSINTGCPPIREEPPRARQQHVGEPPLIIAGTSFGSLIGLHTVLFGKHKFHGAVWGSTTIGGTWNPQLWAESKLAKPLAAPIPAAKLVPAVQHDLLCRDPKFLTDLAWT
ncbi:hypothetical protein PR001_g15004 [Phytophthora rubi]|uniref:Serine aminopeptidase S33 domain-containing protein n=1 Tax=Phytophthora rubi TaxID=129364 RepID=A0A6A3L9U0_9STRA|nr:hypothetical protein PR001_g15004 [Phytophthora rubi]